VTYALPSGPSMTKSRATEVPARARSTVETYEYFIMNGFELYVDVVLIGG